MNRERLLELADEIETPKKLLTLAFDMGDFITGGKYDEYPYTVGKPINCGTAACIGGYACLLFGAPGDDIDSRTAQRLLDLDEREAGQLFFNNDYFIVKQKFGVQDFCGPNGITRAQAADAIRKMANR